MLCSSTANSVFAHLKHLLKLIEYLVVDVLDMNPLIQLFHVFGNLLNHEHASA